MRIILLIFLIGFYTSGFAKECDPFDAKCKLSISVLTQYKLAELQMVGTINTKDKIWGIIKTPEKQVYLVSIGSPLGIEGGHVLQINSQQITIQGKQVETIGLQHIN